MASSGFIYEEVSVLFFCFSFSISRGHKLFNFTFSCYAIWFMIKYFILLYTSCVFELIKHNLFFVPTLDFFFR